MLKASVIISASTLLSRIFGFLRDVVLAKFLGAGATTDALFIALRLPNMFRQLFAEGAFNVAFVPMRTKLEKEEGTQAAKIFTDAVFAALMALIIILSALAFIFMPQLVGLLAPGLRHTPEVFNLAVNLSYITFPYLACIVIANFMGSVLQTKKRFFAFAFAPALLNLSFIVCLLGQSFFPAIQTLIGPPIFAAAWAVPLGGILQIILLLIAFLRAGFTLKIERPKKHPQLGPLLQKIGPTLIGVGAQQINTFIGTIMASFMAAGSISYLFYADRLSHLPLALIGIALGTALLPTLTTSFLEDRQTAHKTLGDTLTISFALGAAAATGLITLAPEIIQTLFMRGAFTAHASTHTAHALMAYSLGLPAYVLVKITSAAFYAQHDTKTPVKMSLISIIANLGLMFALTPFLGHIGLALATALAGWVNALLQLKTLYSQKLSLSLRGIFIKGALSTAFMAAVIITLKTAFPYPESGGSFTLQCLWLIGAISLGVACWAGAAYVLKLHKTIKNLL